MTVSAAETRLLILKPLNQISAAQMLKQVAGWPLDAADSHYLKVTDLRSDWIFGSTVTSGGNKLWL